MIVTRPNIRLQPGQRPGAFHRQLRRYAGGGYVGLPYIPSPDFETDMPPEPDLPTRIQNARDEWLFDKREREDPTKRKGGPVTPQGRHRFFSDASAYNKRGR
jgi:hypothetical protein